MEFIIGLTLNIFLIWLGGGGFRKYLIKIKNKKYNKNNINGRFIKKYYRTQPIKNNYRSIPVNLCGDMSYINIDTV